MEKFEPSKTKTEEEKVVISIRIDEKLVNKIDQLSRDIDISRNEFIKQCIKYALDNLESNYVTKKKGNDVLSSIS